MEIKKIALHLSGKHPPNYSKISRLHFFEKLESEYGIDTTKATFWWEQANKYEEEFYTLVLEYLYSKAWEDLVQLQRINDFIDSFWFDEDITKPVYDWSKFENLLKNKYGDSPTNNDKWELFEQLCRDILIRDGFTNVNIASRGADWWVDITADKEILIWLNTKKSISFFWQCKYKTSSNVSKEEVEQLTWPIIKDTNNNYQWLIFMTNTDYMPNAKAELDSLDNSRANMKSLYLNWSDLLDIINNHLDLMKAYSI